METRAVVTCFLRQGGQVFLSRRGDADWLYPGRWGAVTAKLSQENGDDAETPETAARRVIRAETGLDEAVTLARVGDRFRVDEGEQAWLVHPFLFETPGRAGDSSKHPVDSDDDAADRAWMHPPEIHRLETVPGLWKAYDRVRPTVEDVRSDTDHGAAWLSLRAMEVLRDEAAMAAEGETERTGELTTLARELIAARPSMTVVENRLNRVLDSASETAASGDAALKPAAVESAAAAGIEAAVTADAGAAAVAAERVEADRLCTLSRSGTVRAAIERIDPAAVLVAASRPGREGVAVAEELASEYDVTLTSDAAMASQIERWEADAVLVGADTVLHDGSVLNKVGTRAAALGAANEGIPCYAVASVDKVAADAEVSIETASEPIYEGDAPLSVTNPLFDIAPADCLDGVCTEEGLLDGGDLREVARRHGDRREW